MSLKFERHDVSLYLGECRAVMAELPEASVDAIVTDPPYGLEFMGKEWDKLGAHAEARTRRSAEMGDENKRRYIAFGVNGYGANGLAMQTWHEAWARAALRLLKPGGHLVAFGGTRTHHRLTCALEDAGFEIRDCLMFLHGMGFPKSQNVNKAMEKAGYAICRCSADHDNVHGVPETDPALLGAPQESHKADLFQSVQRRTQRGGVGEAWIQGASRLDGDEPHVISTEDERAEESSMEGRRDAQAPEGQLQRGAIRAGAGVGTADGASGRLHHGAPASHGDVVRSIADEDGSGQPRGPQTGAERPGESDALADEQGSQAGGAWPLCPRCGQPMVPSGLGSALKPAWEPIVLARKPLGEATVAANVLKWGTGALNIDGSRINPGEHVPGGGNGQAHNGGGFGQGFTTGTRPIVQPHTLGRWPANLVLSHSPGCEQTGTKRVKSPGGEADYTVTDKQMSVPIIRNVKSGAHYGDADGMETVDAWACVPECAVRLLDAQSGERTSTASARYSDAPNYRNKVFGRGMGGTVSPSNQHSDTGGASRFFATFGGGGACGDESTRDASTSAGRRAANSDASSPTDGLGNKNMDLSPPDTRSTIETRTPSTTTPATSNASPPSGMTPTTSASEKITGPLTASSIGAASDVESTGRSRTSTSVEPGPSADIADRAHATPSESGEPAIESTSTPTCGPTTGNVRFHYTSKADKVDRDGSKHPTIKPLDLMKWLVRLVAPPGALILDPFMGSGSTVAAARALGGYRIIGIDQDPASVEDAIRRLRQEVLAL